MADGRSKLKDLANAFEKGHEILRCRLSKLGFESEGTNGDQNFDSAAPEDQEKHKRLVRTNIVSSARGRQNAPLHLQLRRRHSGDISSLSTTLNGPRRRAMSLYSSISELPKLPLGRRASDPASRASNATCQLYQPGKRVSIREVLPENPERSSRGLTTIPRRASSASTYRDSNWRIKLHNRSITIDNDDDEDERSHLANSLSRRSSSSSGFSSQSSLF